MQFHQKSSARKTENNQVENVVADDDVRELLNELVVQMRLTNMYLAKIANEYFDEESLNAN